MRVVSENSPEELARNHAAERLVWPLRELTANLMRIVRGAGKPYEVERQAYELLKACQDYRDTAGCGPSWEFTDGLRLDRGREDQAWDDFTHAEDMMVNGALQIAASQLLNQAAQQSRGEDELHKGIRYLQEARAEFQRKHAEESAKKKPGFMAIRAAKKAKQKPKS